MIIYVDLLGNRLLRRPFWQATAACRLYRDRESGPLVRPSPYLPWTSLHFSSNSDWRVLIT